MLRAVQPTGNRRQLGRYELIARIGEGGMAEVQLARLRGAMGFEKLVVVKLVHEHLASQKSFVEMLMQEARLAALVKHPNVVDIYDLGESEGRYFLAMEYLAGEPMLAVLRAGRDGRRLDPFSTGRLIAEVAEGLTAAHQLRSLSGEAMPLVHHDISLGNIMVLYTGQAKLVDFGVAKAGDAASNADRDRIKGKFGYMAPEKLRGDGGDARSDLFSLGVVLWEALTLRRLFRADNDLEAIQQVLEEPITPPSQVNGDVPKAFDRICARALERDVSRRYQTAAEMAKDIEAVLKEASYSGKYEVIAQYMQETFEKHIQARSQLIKEASTLHGPSDQLVNAAFASDLTGERSISSPELEVPRPPTTPAAEAARARMQRGKSGGAGPGVITAAADEPTQQQPMIDADAAAATAQMSSASLAAAMEPTATEVVRDLTKLAGAPSEAAVASAAAATSPAAASPTASPASSKDKSQDESAARTRREAENRETIKVASLASMGEVEYAESYKPRPATNIGESFATAGGSDTTIDGAIFKDMSAVKDDGGPDGARSASPAAKDSKDTKDSKAPKDPKSATAAKEPKDAKSAAGDASEPKDAKSAGAAKSARAGKDAGATKSASAPKDGKSASAARSANGTSSAGEASADSGAGGAASAAKDERELPGQKHPTATEVMVPAPPVLPETAAARAAAWADHEPSVTELSQSPWSTGEHSITEVSAPLLAQPPARSIIPVIPKVLPGGRAAAARRPLIEDSENTEVSALPPQGLDGESAEPATTVNGNNGAAKPGATKAGAASTPLPRLDALLAKVSPASSTGNTPPGTPALSPPPASVSSGGLSVPTLPPPSVSGAGPASGPADASTRPPSSTDTGTRDVLGGWGWSTGAAGALSAEELADPRRLAALRRKTAWMVGGGVGVIALVAIVALATGGSQVPAGPGGLLRPRLATGAPEDKADAALAEDAAGDSATFPGATRPDQIALAPETSPDAGRAPDEGGEVTTPAGKPGEPQGEPDAGARPKGGTGPIVSLVPSESEVPVTPDGGKGSSPGTAGNDRPDGKPDGKPDDKINRPGGTRGSGSDRPDREEREEREEREDKKLDVEATFKAGQAEFLRGDAKAALATFRKITSASPGFAPAWRGSALALERLGQKPAAAKALRRYLKLAPNAGDAAQIKARLERLE